MSLLVVINGPVARAGSIPNLSSNKGIKVPINEAMIITEINAIETIIPSTNSRFNKKCPPINNIEANIIPLNKLKEISFKSRLKTEPLNVLFAKP